MAEPARIKVYKVEEVAQMLRCSRQWVHAEINAGRLQAWRCGRLIRIPHESLQDYLCASSTTGADGPSSPETREAASEPPSDTPQPTRTVRLRSGRRVVFYGKVHSP